MRAGSLSDYRLARLIRYSFYKNIAFSFTFFWFQFYNGWSGQACVLHWHLHLVGSACLLQTG